jgi:hypothetical protein
VKTSGKVGVQDFEESQKSPKERGHPLFGRNGPTEKVGVHNLFCGQKVGVHNLFQQETADQRLSARG